MKRTSHGNGPSNDKSKLAKKEPPKPKSTKVGPNTCREANQRAAIVLEVLAGIRTPSQAAAALKKSVNYYYVIERKALQGLLAACQPKLKGPSSPGPAAKIEQLTRQLAQCRNECQRQAALVRATQRAVGIPAPAAKKPAAKKDAKGRKRKRRKPAVRALLAVRELQKDSSLEPAADAVEQTVSASPQPSPSNAEN